MKYWLPSATITRSLAHGAELVPAGPLIEERHLGEDTRDIEAAGRDEDHVGVGGAEVVPVEPGRVLASLSEERRAAGHGDELAHPVATRHERLYPLDAGHARPGGELARGRFNSGHPFTERGHQPGHRPRAAPSASATFRMSPNTPARSFGSEDTRGLGAARRAYNRRQYGCNSADSMQGTVTIDAVEEGKHPNLFVAFQGACGTFAGRR